MEINFRTFRYSAAQSNIKWHLRLLNQMNSCYVPYLVTGKCWYRVIPDAIEFRRWNGILCVSVRVRVWIAFNFQSRIIYHNWIRPTLCIYSISIAFCRRWSVCVWRCCDDIAWNVLCSRRLRRSNALCSQCSQSVHGQKAYVRNAHHTTRHTHKYANQIILFASLVQKAYPLHFASFFYTFRMSFCFLAYSHHLLDGKIGFKYT